MTGNDFGAPQRFRRACAPDLRPASSIVTEDTANKITTGFFAGAGVFAVLSVVFYIGPFAILAQLFPSAAARQTQSSLKRASQGQRYDRSANQRYRDRPAGGFQRKQDIQELRTIVMNAKDDLSRAKQRLDDLKKKDDAAEADFKAAEREFKDAVNRAKAAQKKMESARDNWRQGQ